MTKYLKYRKFLMSLAIRKCKLKQSVTVSHSSDLGEMWMSGNTESRGGYRKQALLYPAGGSLEQPVTETWELVKE